MAIQQIKIEGYRSLKDVTWTPGKLNLLVGPNGSGKSNVLRCLELISDVARGRLRESLQLHEGIIPLLWDHRSRGLAWRARIDPVDTGRDREKDPLTFSFRLSQASGSGFEIAEDSLGNWQQFERGEKSSPSWIYSRDARRTCIFDIQSQQLVPWTEYASDNLQGYDPDESLLSQIADRRNRIPQVTRRAIDDWRVFHDVHVDRGSQMRRPATTQVTRRLNPDGSNLATVLHTLYNENREFKTQIDEGMSAGYGSEYEELRFPPAASQQIQLAILWKSSSQPHAGSDLSDGTLRFLFLLTALANPEPAPLIAIDEPELGLHPSMLPIIAEYAEAAAERTQVVLTTHSPEFLDAFSQMSPAVTVCHWEEGQTTLHSLPPDSLAKWLAHYRLGEMFTRGELDSLALPPVEEPEGAAQRFANLPPEQELPIPSHSE